MTGSAFVKRRDHFLSRAELKENVMSLFRNPQEHAANPPESWVVVRKGNRSWALQTASAVLT